MVAAPSSQGICSNCVTLLASQQIIVPNPTEALSPLSCAGRRRWVLPPSGGCKQVGTTPGLSFRAVIGVDGKEEMEVAL